MVKVPDDAQVACEALAERLVQSGAERDLQVAAYLDGQLVVDVSAGASVRADSLFESWSTGKGVTATALHVVAGHGLIDYDAPIVDYWPEFGAHSKGAATVRDALTHSTGVPQFPTGVTSVAQLADWDGMCARIADLRPIWAPGTATGYHGWTFGWIVGEIVRRASGRDVGAVIRDDIARPLGMVGSLCCGVEERDLPKVVELVDGGFEDSLTQMPDALRQTTPPPPLSVSATLGNRADFLRALIPAAGVGSARALARMYAAIIGEVGGVRLISLEQLQELWPVRTDAVDRVTGIPVAKNLGYFCDFVGMGGRRSAFGMNGSGGSLAFADPEYGFALAVTKSRMTGFGPTAVTAQLIAETIRSSLGIAEGGRAPFHKINSPTDH